jgi:hypothetical protein
MSVRAAVYLACLLLALAGCAQDTSPQGICERQSWDDPDVKDLMRRMGGVTNDSDRMKDLLARTRKRAVMQCLQADGILPPGGVEQVIVPR